MTQVFKLSVAALLLLAACSARAGETPQEQRHELMEGVGDAAKPVGEMLKGERAFDAGVANASLQTWADAAATLGDLFPAGSESGYDTRARAEIWTDRAGFEAALADFAAAVDAAIAAQPQDLEGLNAAAGPVFKKCKACHEDYRTEED